MMNFLDWRPRNTTEKIDVSDNMRMIKAILTAGCWVLALVMTIILFLTLFYGGSILINASAYSKEALELAISTIMVTSLGWMLIMVCMGFLLRDR